MQNFSKHEGDVQAQWDIFTMKIREAVEFLDDKCFSTFFKSRVCKPGMESIFNETHKS